MPEYVRFEISAEEELEGFVLERDWFGSPTLIYVPSTGQTYRRDWIGIFRLESAPGRSMPPTA